jgi:hypothetical protein
MATDELLLQAYRKLYSAVGQLKDWQGTPIGDILGEIDDVESASAGKLPGEKPLRAPLTPERLQAIRKLTDGWPRLTIVQSALIELILEVEQLRGERVIGKLGPEQAFIFAEDSTIAARIDDDGTVRLAASKEEWWGPW